MGPAISELAKGRVTPFLKPIRKNRFQKSHMPFERAEKLLAVDGIAPPRFVLVEKAVIQPLR
jgi:hypothetical protein